MRSKDFSFKFLYSRMRTGQGGELMNLEKTVIIQGYRFKHEGNELLQINRFYPDQRLTISTYQLSSKSLAYSEDDLLYELEYPVQEEKLMSLRRKIAKEFFDLPLGLASSPAFLALQGEDTIYRYAWIKEDLISEPFQKLHESILRIVSYSSIPSG